MSLIIGALIGIFLAFLPLMMAVYYKSPSVVIIINFFLCLIGLFTIGITTVIAFVIAAVDVGLKKTIFSILFAIFLCFMGLVLAAAEFTALAAMIGISMS